MPGTFDTLPQFLATIKRTVGLPKFSFREIKNSGKFEIVFGKFEEITFPSDKIPSIIRFKGVSDGRGSHIGTKRTQSQKNDAKRQYQGLYG